MFLWENFKRKLKMPQSSFIKRKKDVLGKLDKSFIGKWDKKIISLCEKINKTFNYYTTSSCSGRVVLVKDVDKKSPGVFLWVSHDLIKLKILVRELGKVQGDVKFKQEPVILHVACFDLESAQKIVDKAKDIGLKRSGIIASKKNFIVEMMGTEKLEFPIVKKGEILVEKVFLESIVEKSNGNLKKTWAKIDRLKRLI